MTFEEYKERCEGHFGRTLSDREVAEIALNTLSEKDEETESMNDALDMANERIEALKSELAYTGENKEIKMVANRLTEILDLPGETHEFQLRFYNGKLVNFLYKVAGSMEFEDEEA